MTNGNWLGLKTSRDGNPGTAALVAKGIRDSDPRVWRRGWELGGPVEGQGLGHPQPQSSCQEGPPSFSICFTVAVRAEFTVSTVLHVFPRQTRRAQRRIHIFPTSIHSHLRKEGEGDHGGVSSGVSLQRQAAQRLWPKAGKLPRAWKRKRGPLVPPLGFLQNC